MKKLNIIINAYACNPLKGSEPGVGWGFVKELAKFHNLIVITEKNENESAILNNPINGVKFVYIERKRFKFFEKFVPYGYYFSYFLWQLNAYKWVKNYLKDNYIDLIHQLNMIGYREPGLLYLLNIPFVIGPIGGFGYFPSKYLFRIGISGLIHYTFYNVFNFFQSRVNIRLRHIIAKKGILVSSNSENRYYISKYLGYDSKICIPVGPPNIFIDKYNIKKKKIRFKIIWCGLIIERKALFIALKSLAILRDLDWEFHIIGDGSLIKESIMLAVNLNIYDKCIFHGWKSREFTLSEMADSDLFLFTSLREGTPTVLAEADYLSVPILCFDISGMSDMVNNHNGVKINFSEINHYNKFATEIRDFILGKYNDSFNKMSNFSSHLLSWESKSKFFNEIYSRAIDDWNK